MDPGDQADRVKFMIRDRGSNFTAAFDARYSSASSIRSSLDDKSASVNGGPCAAIAPAGRNRSPKNATRRSPGISALAFARYPAAISPSRSASNHTEASSIPPLYC
jgi:hypothetical protein